MYLECRAVHFCGKVQPTWCGSLCKGRALLALLSLTGTAVPGICTVSGDTDCRQYTSCMHGSDYLIVFFKGIESYKDAQTPRDHRVLQDRQVAQRLLLLAATHAHSMHDMMGGCSVWLAFWCAFQLDFLW